MVKDHVEMILGFIDKIDLRYKNQNIEIIGSVSDIMKLTEEEMDNKQCKLFFKIKVLQFLFLHFCK